MRYRDMEYARIMKCKWNTLEYNAGVSNAVQRKFIRDAIIECAMNSRHTE